MREITFGRNLSLGERVRVRGTPLLELATTTTATKARTCANNLLFRPIAATDLDFNCHTSFPLTPALSIRGREN
jgi:hypothetical protein